jgi:hypothetical protein
MNTKIRLSEQELELLNNSAWILAKNSIILKTRNLLENLAIDMDQVLRNAENDFFDKIPHSTPKVSKGENYQGLPYLVLDYPRTFVKNDIFAIRTFFWWGKFFSITLHLSGNFKSQFEANLNNSIGYLKDNGFYVCSSENQWDHHFEKTNYTNLQELSDEEIKRLFTENAFLKIAKRLPLQDWNEIEEILLKNFKAIIKLLN